MTCVDINCDLGEGVGDDAAVMPFITSANVACGAHAGDATTMRRTIAAAAQAGVAIGAHPGFADRAGFGRHAQALPPDEIFDLVLTQIAALAALARVYGVRLAHVKPHGALYHVAAVHPDAADAIARAIHTARSDLIVVGPPDSALTRAAGVWGLRFAGEIFADRGYGDDGRLLPRGQPGALLSLSPAAAATRAVTMVQTQTIASATGRSIPQAGDTVCLHGDDPAVVPRAQALRLAMQQAGIAVLPLAAWR